MTRQSPHTYASPRARVRHWLAPGNVPTTADRTDRGWLITAGPPSLIGRTFRRIRDARNAAKDTRPD